ncbi:E3 ubiquitin-protein ligase NEDD4-like [Dendronephthya gigantea]|uniref:E3 ubiquitin-protein ligase NEDD4-like n=1 Tax=Dendronephthya gigantea TaxID=151771 RepID=UPI00106D716A|nr:E3 ubiquitin-protein ligase NEDD4-like [Dendronephthya gigantea]
MGQSQSSDSGGNACLAKSEETTLECVVKSKESDRSTVEEKLKEVICKTVVNIPLTEGKPGNEAIETNLAPESSSSCVDTDGKLLVKIIRASGLTGIDKADVPDAYCVLGSKGTTEKKKTKTIKGTKDPVWNESHVIDMSEKTKEIVFDIFNEQKTSEEEGFLGQVIVPLGMIGKDQSCRLILPVLPTSSKNSYVGGQIHLEFTYDKDGKAFETSTEAASSKPNVTSEQKKESDLPKAKVEEVRPSSPQRLVFSMATLDIIDDDDDKLEFLPLLDHGIGREDIVEAEHKISERSKHGGYETDPVLIEENKKHQEMFQELIELDEQTALQDGSKIQQNQVKNEPAKTSQQRSPPQQSLTTTSPVQVSVTLPSPDEPQKVGTGEKPEEAKPSTDATEGAPSKQDKMKEPLTLDESLMEDLTPNTKRKVFRKAFSMRIRRDQEPPSERIETNVQQSRSSGVEKRHSFSGGEKVQPITKSGSDVSLNSLYDSAKSVLVVETRDRGKIKYYQIPSLMARRGTFDHKGCKLHICNDHLFVATHFTGTLPSCAVCSLPLTGYFGKQGYECRDCHMITHKRCHYETTDVCAQSTLSSLKIKKAPSIHGYK